MSDTIDVLEADRARCCTLTASGQGVRPCSIPVKEIPVIYIYPVDPDLCEKTHSHKFVSRGVCSWYMRYAIDGGRRLSTTSDMRFIWYRPCYNVSEKKRKKENSACLDWLFLARVLRRHGGRLEFIYYWVCVLIRVAENAVIVSLTRRFGGFSTSFRFWCLRLKQQNMFQRDIHLI